MKISRNASTASMTGRVPDNFTGAVRVDNLSNGAPPSRVGTGVVTFSPGARTVWHTHPAGQTIIITAGKGWVQREGGSREEVGPGDTVFFDADERHWHGATADTGLTKNEIIAAITHAPSTRAGRRRSTSRETCKYA